MKLCGVNPTERWGKTNIFQTLIEFQGKVSNMKISSYLKSIVVLCLLPMLFFSASVTHAASLSCGTWSVVTSPNPGVPDGLSSVAAVSSSDVWAVGSAGSQMGSGQTVIEHWNGTQWGVVTSPSPDLYNTLTGVAVVSTSNVWAVGWHASGGSTRTLIEHWNGTQWSVVKSPSPASIDNELFGVTALSASNVWAVGFIASATAIGPVQQTLIEHWNGTNWSVVKNPSPGSSPVLNGVTAVSSSDVWAVGNVGFTQTLIEHWNGTSWSVGKSPSPGSGDDLRDVAAVSASNAWAAGYTFNGSSIQTLIEHWNGTSWQVVKSPNVGTAPALNGVAAVSARDVWTVGSYQNSNNVGLTLTEHWNGTQWSIVKSPSPGSFNTQLLGVAAISASNVWAVGHADSQTLIEHYC